MSAERGQGKPCPYSGIHSLMVSGSTLPLRTNRSRWIFPAVWASAFLTLALLAELVVRPLHLRGVGHPATAYVGGATRLLSLPGLAILGESRLRARSPPTPAQWLASLALGAAFHFALAIVVRRWWLGRRGTGPASPPMTAAPSAADVAPPAPRAVTRRQVLVAGRRVALGAAVGGVAYCFLGEREHFGVTRRSLLVRDLPPSLDKFTVCQITDIHYGPWTSLGWLRRIVSTANGLRPDLIVLTGDYVYQSGAYIAPAVAELAQLRGQAGVLAVLGNHDWWEDGPLTQREFGRAGIPLIDNERAFVTPDRRLLRTRFASKGLCIAGVGDLWEGGPDYEAALGGVPASMPRLLLAHNPDCAEDRRLLNTPHRVDLMLSGHTHGGQVRIPGLGTPVIPSSYGQKYASGLVQGPRCPVFVSRGLGTTQLPLRIGVRPEIAMIELRAAGTTV